MKKRGNGEGSIYKRADGRWTATVSLERGQRKSFYATTRDEVARKLTVALKSRQEGLPVTSDRQTVSRYLDGWLKAVEPSLKRRTFIRYEQYCRLHVIPQLGHLPLWRVSPQHLQKLYADKLSDGLSPTTVAHLHATIHKAFAQAAKWGQVPRNVADLVTKPRMKPQQMKTLLPEQARQLLDAAAGHRLEALIVLALSTGARQGELLGLRWADVNMHQGTMQIRASLQRVRGEFVFSQPKTARSRRQIQLTESVVAVLRRHRASQIKERLAAGGAWHDLNLVFCNSYGQPIHATDLIRVTFYPMLDRAGLPRIRFHDLRHSCASLLLTEGIHPKIVADMLGHATISITLDLYSHTTVGMHRQAALALEAVLAR